MNKNLLSLILLLFIGAAIQGQTKSLKEGSSIGILFISDFFQNSTNNSNANSQGVAINFKKGIALNYNVSTTINGLFIDYPIDNKQQGTSGFLFEWDILCRRKFNVSAAVMPYVGTGITSSVYKDNVGLLLPVNVGLQVKLTDQLFLLTDAQYKWKLTSNTASHLQLSIGISSPIFQKRKRATVSSSNFSKVDALPSLRDSDGDGIVDTADACPHVAGVARYKGCPIPDADKDGVNDEEDKCPDIAGAKSNGGCPIIDRDNDGIVDSLDHCPDIPGDIADNGCPSLESSGFHASAIQFVSNSAELVPASFAELDKLVDFLNKYDSMKVAIEGHTDNVGSTTDNQKLSERRAITVKKYLLSKGIKEERITTNGFGFSRPIADNSTAEGRQRNRRVEFKISQ